MRLKDKLSKEELCCQTINTIHGNVYWKDKDLRYIDANPFQIEHFGQVIGKTDYDLFKKEEAEAIRSNDLLVMQTGEAHIFEETVTNILGQEANYLTYKNPLLNKEGAIIGVIGMSFNITQQKALQKKEKKEKEQVELVLSHIMANLPGNVYWKDSSFIYQGSNDMLAHFIGLTSSKEILGKDDFELAAMLGWSKEVAEKIREIDSQIIKSGIPQLNIEEGPLYDAKGNKVMQLSSKVPYKDAKGNVIGLIGISFDITKQREMQTALQKALNDIEEANLTKTELIMNMQHDIRTPFNSLYQGLEYLHEMEEDQDKKEMLWALLQSVIRLLNYCNEIIAFGQTMVHGIANHEKKFDIRKLVTSITEAQGVSIKLKNLKFKLDISKSVPAAIIGDNFGIEKVLMSLLSNAIKFTEQGEISLLIKKVKKLTDDQLVLRFEITDTGIGIPEEKVLKLFEMFAKVHASNTQTYDGQGLGLYLSKKFVEKMGGYIELVSKLGVGTSVRFDIPVRKALTDDCLELKEK